MPKQRNLCDLLEHQTTRVGELEEKLRCAIIEVEAAETARKMVAWPSTLR